jgi:hypothetical protein
MCRRRQRKKFARFIKLAAIRSAANQKHRQAQLSGFQRLRNGGILVPDVRLHGTSAKAVGI